MQVSVIIDFLDKFNIAQSQWLRGLRRGSAVTLKVVFGVRIPLEQFVSCKCTVFSFRMLYDGLITRQKESY
jgi:hypothetical protein